MSKPNKLEMAKLHTIEVLSEFQIDKKIIASAVDISIEELNDFLNR